MDLLDVEDAIQKRLSSFVHQPITASLIETIAEEVIGILRHFDPRVPVSIEVLPKNGEIEIIPGNQETADLIRRIYQNRRDILPP